MKKPVRFLFSRKVVATLLFLSAAAIYTSNNLPGEFESEESEREESAAEVLGPWDYMGSMRSWPNPNGEISAAKYVEAFEHMKRMPVAKTNSDPRSRVQAPSPWVPLGPMNFAGRVLSLAFHPTDPNTMWCGAASGGLWKTTNGGYGTAGGGINWTQVQTGFPVTSVPAIAVNPTDANEIFIGTGEVYNTGTNTGFPGQNIRTFRGSYGIGILKSTNGGTTWTQSLPFTNSAVKGVTHILYRPGTPSTIFAATSDGVYRSTNSGTSWTLVLNVPLAMDMDFSPGRPDTLYVTCGVFNSTGSGIYRCLNSSAATPTFTQLTTGLPASASINGMTRLSICPDDRNIIYAAVGKIPGTGGGTAAPTVGATFGLYKSTDAGNTWTATAQPQLSGTHYIAGQGWYAHDVLAGTNASQRVIAAEIDMLRSVNGGGSWTQISQWNLWDFSATGTTVGDPTEGTANNQDYVHADIHRMYLSPHDASYNTIFVVTDGGVFRSTDGGTNFNSLNGGLMTAQIYHKMSVHPTNSNLMLCGLQDNATLLYEGSTGCRRTMGGDGFYTAIDQSNPNYCYGTYTYGTWYNSTTGPTGAFGGATWTNTMNGATSTPNENAAFVAPVVLAPSNPNRLYVGTIYLRRFSNPRVDATQLAVGNGGAAISGANNPIMAIGVSQTFADSIYIATAPGGANPGRMYRSTNGGTSVTNITGTLPNRYFSYIAVDPTNSQRVAVSVSGFGTSHVYFSSNGGGTWNDIGGVGGTALPDVPANVVMFDPTTPTTLYVGTDMGVFVAQNITTGSTQPIWYTYNAGWTDVTPVMDLLVAPNGKLRAGTFGKGLWENNMVTGQLPVTFESFTVTPSQGGNQLRWVIGVQDNVSHYEVEYSTDGISFSSVATVQPKSGPSKLTYDFTHKITNTVKGYYRIKVVDLDGSISYSQIEEVKAVSGVVKISAYPNPTPGKFKVRIPAQLSGTVELSIYDDIGRLVVSERVQISGNTEVPMDISRLASGSYQIICENRSVQYVTRVVKK